MKRRSSGILLHITSIPSPFGVGDMGPGAYSFADFLKESGQSLWQILPLNPTSLAYGNSPYNSHSAFAGNPLLISPEIMVRDGYLKRSDIESCPHFSMDRVDYKSATAYKYNLLHIAFERRRGRLHADSEFEKFCIENACWIEDYTLFMSLKRHFEGKVWNRWPDGLRQRREGVVREWKDRLSEFILREKFYQYLFFRQWFSLKEYCNNQKIQIIGDVPIYVHYDSPVLWSKPELFKLDKDGSPEFIAGVPPDYFSTTGQLWGNPVYRWDVLKESGYRWWIKRIQHNLRLFNIIRLDHFRGFIAYWEVNAREKTAVKGRWVNAPAMDFFSTLTSHFSSLPVIAEDLGVITPDISEVMRRFGFPGMKLLLFAFGKDLPYNNYAPHNYSRNCVVYTGTHDNNTVLGWFRNETGPGDKDRLFRYIGHRTTEMEIHHELIRLAMMSVANTAIIPMQDILGLGEEARMNIPSKPYNNWCWRLLPEQLSSSLAEYLFNQTEIYGRL